MRNRLLRYVVAYRPLLGGVLAAMLATSAVELLSPWPMKLLVDHVLGGQALVGRTVEGALRDGLTLVGAGAYVLLAAVRGGLGVVQRRWLVEVSQRAGLALRADLYARVQRLSLRFHDCTPVGDVVTRLTGDVDRLQDAVVDGVSLLSTDVLTVLGITAVMVLVDWRFAAVALAVLPPLFLVFATFRQRIRDAARAVRAGDGALAALAQEVLASIRAVKAFGREDLEHERFIDRTRARQDASIRAVTCESVFGFWIELATASGMAAVMGYGTWRVVRGELTLGQLLVFAQYLTALYAAVRRVSRLTGVVQKASASAERVGDLLRLPPEVPVRPHPKRLARVRGEVVFEDVYFGYEARRAVLHGVNLRVTPGEVVALTGASGHGKSTLVSLVPRFYDPTRGRVLVDGVDVRDLDLPSLREQIAIVLQDPLLFSGTVHDNIAYGRPGAGEQEVIAAARAAQAHGFIAGLAQGYQTPIAERGVTLSGGQRQRIAIARAILKDAPILILDEPTSAVDAASEHLIGQAVAELVRDRTVLIISHRAATLEWADRVVRLDAGTLVEDRPAELTARPASLTGGASGARPRDGQRAIADQGGLLAVSVRTPAGCASVGAAALGAARG